METNNDFAMDDLNNQATEFLDVINTQFRDTNNKEDETGEVYDENDDDYEGEEYEEEEQEEAPAGTTSSTLGDVSAPKNESQLSFQFGKS